MLWVVMKVTVWVCLLGKCWWEAKKTHNSVLTSTALFHFVHCHLLLLSVAFSVVPYNASLLTEEHGINGWRDRHIAALLNAPTVGRRHKWCLGSQMLFWLDCVYFIHLYHLYIDIRLWLNGNTSIICTVPGWLTAQVWFSRFVLESSVFMFWDCSWQARVYQKGKTNLDLLEQENEWLWHQLGHMQICTSPQTDNHASIPPLSFYRLDAFPAAQPTAANHRRPVCNLYLFNSNDNKLIYNVP